MIRVLKAPITKTIFDEKTGSSITRTWKKGYRTDKYEILVDTDNGQWMEILHGQNNNGDPSSLLFPSLLDIGIMGHCSNNCSYCYQGDTHNQHMSLEMFKEIIDQCKLYVNQVALGGRGDPNQHPDFLKFLEYCIKNDVLPNYTTSGKGFTKEHLGASSLCGAIAVSDHRKEYTFKTLNMLIDKGYETNIHYILSKYSFEEAMGILRGKDVWNGRVNLEGLNALIFLKFKSRGNGKDKDWSPTSKQLDVFSKTLEKLKSEELKFKIGLDSCLVNTIKTRRDFTENEHLCADTCEAARMSAYITEDGKILPCSFGDHSTAISIRGNIIGAIWNRSSLFEIMRKELKEQPSSCPYKL